MSDAGRAIVVNGAVDETCTSLGTVEGSGYDQYDVEITKNSTQGKLLVSGEESAVNQARNRAADLGGTHIVLGPVENVVADKANNVIRKEVRANVFRCAQRAP